MTHLSSAGVEALSDALRILYEPIELNRFPDRFMDVTARIVPGEMQAIGVVKPRFQTSDGFMNLPAHDLFWKVQAYREEHLKIPCLADGSYQLSEIPVSLHDYMTVAEFKETAIYQVYYQPLGLLYDLTVNFHVSAETTYCMTSVRGDRRHNAEERKLFHLLQPHLKQRFQQLLASDPGHPVFSQGRLLQDQHWLLSTAEGEIIDRNPSTEGLLRKLQLPGNLSALPTKWKPWFDRQLGPLESRYQRSPLILPAGSSQISVFAIPNFASGQHRLILTEEAAGRTPKALTTREREIADWLLEGKTNPEMAIILGVSLGTVKKHVENILTKLGVETRTAAAAMLMRFDEREKRGS